MHEKHEPTTAKIYDNITQLIGHTPLVCLPKMSKKHDVLADLIFKLEFFNPLSSVKDRIALSMIEGAEKKGLITPGKSVLIEPTSGNTGIGLAYIAAAKGYALILTMPESMSIERRKMLQHFGAKLILTPKEKGMNGAIEAAKDIAATTPNSFYIGQFINPDNPAIHITTTAQEIWDDTAGQIDIFIAGVGTGGTITGVSKALKAKNPNLISIAIEPAESPVLSGGAPGPHKIQGIGAGFIPDILDTSLIDEIIQIDAQDAITMAQDAAKIDGVPLGISSGAALSAAIKIGQRPENKGKHIVTICASSAERYISTDLFNHID